MADPTYPLYPILAFLGFFLTIIPFPWHVKAWNSGTCFYMMWAALACINQFINSVVWHDNAINLAPAWCEISIRIMMGSSVGLPASSLCINRRLYNIISSSNTASISREQKKRVVIIDSLICILFPLIFIALQYVVEGHRFDIYEDIGCFPALYNSVPTYLLSLMWPLVIGTISTTYCILTLYAIVRHRIKFAKVLATHPSITPWRYLRLMALAMTELLFTMPLSAFAIWLNVSTRPIEPWKDWNDTHFAYSFVGQYPALIWRRQPNFVASMEFTRWVVPICAFIFFAFFGVAEEARKNYAVLLKKICALCRGNRPSENIPRSPQSMALVQSPASSRFFTPRNSVHEARENKVTNLLMASSSYSTSTNTIDCSVAAHDNFAPPFPYNHQR